MVYYWTEKTNEAIVRYNNSDNDIERSIIYSKYIHKPVDKMAEYIINRFNFSHIHGTMRDKKADVISHVIMNMGKYNTEKGNNAFGYFSTVIKFYLIQKDGKEYANQKSSVSINEDIDDNDDRSYFLQLENEDDDKKNEIESSEYFIEVMVQYLEKHLDILIYKENEKNVAYAIMQLLENYKSIEKFNKKAIYLILREMSNESPVVITSVINRLKTFYIDISNIYHKYNEIPNDWVYKRNKYSKNFY